MESNMYDPPWISLYREPLAAPPEPHWKQIARETVAKLRKAADEIERALDAK